MTDASREYGSALYQLCSEEGVDAPVLEQLGEVRQLLAHWPDWGRLLACPTVPAAERRTAAEQVLAGRVHPYLLNFVRLLIDAGRAGELDGCASYYARQYDEAHGILPVTAVTAVPLNEAQTQRLTEKLARSTGKQIRLTNRVDASCMGGVRLELAGRSVDGSVSARLEQLRQTLLRGEA